VKEYSNKISKYYRPGSYAENLSAKQIVYTEHELQSAISRALAENGIFPGKE